MNHRHTKLPVIARVFAAAWLLVWLTAQTICVHHCASMAFAQGKAAGGCCAKKSSDSAKGSSSSGAVVCGGLKTVKLESKTELSVSAAVVVTTVKLVLTLPLPEPHLDSFVLRPRRAVPRVDWVFLPEVSLGAAFRALAPPALA